VKILLTNATDIFAGGEDYVLVLATHLRARGHELWVSALPGHLLLEKCAARGLPSIPLEYRGMGRLFQVARQLRHAMLERGIQIVHSNANYDRTAAAFAAARTGIVHVAGVHSTHSIQHNVTHWVRNRLLTRHFITDAEAGKRVLVEQDGIAPSRVTTVPIGIEAPAPEHRDAARARIRAELGVSEQTLVIGNVARLVPFKGHRVLLDAAAVVLSQRHDVLFVIVGDGELDEELHTRARDLGILPSIRFLGFRDDLDDLYAGFDLYCHSSLELAAEMFPIAVLRALGAGLPVVCTEVGGIAAMVLEGVSGYLVPPEDPPALAHALLAVLDSPAQRCSMGEAGFQHFRSHYHAPAMAAKVEEVYRTL
jgi:glycosyltransferase involved in cell wall biosynthesis